MDKNKNTTPSNNTIKNETTKVATKNIKSSAKMKISKSKFSLWLLFIALFVLALFGTYGYVKYNNSQITNLTYLIPTVSFTKDSPPVAPTKNKANPPKAVATTKPVAPAPVKSSNSATATQVTPNFTADSKAYQDFILQLSTKLEQMNKDLSHSKAQQQTTYTNIVNRFNLIYALEKGEVPLHLLQQVGNNADNPKLQKLLDQLEKFSSTGITTKDS